VCERLIYPKLLADFDETCLWNFVSVEGRLIFVRISPTSQAAKT